MTSPAATPPPAPARFRPAPTPGQRALAVLASAAAVAVIAMLVAVFAFFIGNGQSPQVFAQLVPHFALAALLVWVLLAIANAPRRDPGVVPRAASPDSRRRASRRSSRPPSRRARRASPFSGALFLFVVGSLASLNLVFILAVIAGEVFLAPKVLRGIMAYAPAPPAAAHGARAHPRVEPRRGRAHPPRARARRQGARRRAVGQLLRRPRGRGLGDARGRRRARARRLGVRRGHRRALRRPRGDHEPRRRVAPTRDRRGRAHGARDPRPHGRRASSCRARSTAATC